MNVIIEDLAKESIDNIFHYNSLYSIKSAVETDIEISHYIDNIEISPYIGKHCLKFKDIHFRELILKQPKNSYRIIYYISESKGTIYVLYVANCKQNLNRILKIHNYFNSFKLI